MTGFKDKSDPLERRKRELQRQLEKVRSEMRRASAQQAPAERGSPRALRPGFPTPGPAPEPHGRRGRQPLVNEQGVPKFDLPGSFRRIGSLFGGANAYNRHMVRMLAAGSIDGLPVLRREKKRALYRFILLSALFLTILWGIGFTYLRER